MHIPPTKMAFAAAVLGGSLVLGGCATRGYVDEQIAAVNQRIDGIDSRLSAGEGTAGDALTTAQAAAGQSQQNSQRIDQLSGRVDGIDQRLSQQRTPRN